MTSQKQSTIILVVHLDRAPYPPLENLFYHPCVCYELVG